MSKRKNTEHASEEDYKKRYYEIDTIIRQALIDIKNKFVKTTDKGELIGESSLMSLFIIPQVLVHKTLQTLDMINPEHSQLDHIREVLQLSFEFSGMDVTVVNKHIHDINDQVVH